MFKILFLMLFSLTTLYALGSTVEPATISPGTATKSQLMNLPEPKGKIVAAVYSFRDQTGQYRPVTVGTSYSTAVTQGATSMLIKALEDSRWFTIVEREGLGNLLNERKITSLNREREASLKKMVPTPLPPLLYAELILEGGIISYETNVVTGGVGARYLGIGTHASMQKDRVTIYLRAVSTKTGEVIKSVTTSKTILSRMTDAGVYRFVSFKKLFEVETGFSTNEPAQLCVQEAIEKAVLSLVAEGAQTGLWQLKNSSDIENDVFADYFSEKELLYEKMEDLQTAKKLTYRNGIRFYLGTGGEVPESQYLSSGTARAELGMGFDFSPNIGTSFSFNMDIYNYDLARLSNLDFQLDLTVLPEQRITPLFHVGGTLYFVSYDESYPDKTDTKYSEGITYGSGVRFKIAEQVSLLLKIENHTLLGREFDASDHDAVGRKFWGCNFGVRYYPFRSKKSTL